MPRIKDGNSKLGAVANLSLPPVLTCNKKAPCTVKGCYAKSLRRFPGVVRLWESNWRQWQERPLTYESQISEYLDTHELSLFRWHTSGDIPDADYWQMMLRIARKFPWVNFLAFTKQHDLIKGRVPDNLAVVLSAWNDFHIPVKLRRRFRVAWMRDPKNPDPRIPKNALKCPGNCESCGLCWALRKLNRDVVFNKH